MRKSAMIRVIAWSVTIVTLLGILLVGMRGGWGSRDWEWGNFAWNNNTVHEDTYDNADRYQIGNAEVKADGITEIQLYWIAGSVRVELHDGDEILIEETSSRSLSEDHQLRWLLQDGILTVRHLRAGRTRNVPSKALTLKIPRDMEQLTLFALDSISAGVWVEGVTARTVRLESVSGALNATDLICDSLRYDSISGRVTLAGAFGAVDGETVSGSSTLHSTIMPGSLSAESISGSFRVEVPEGDFAALLDSMSGNMSSNIDGARVSKDAVFVGSGGPTFEFETVSGSVRVDRID